MPRKLGWRACCLPTSVSEQHVALGSENPRGLGFSDLRGDPGVNRRSFRT